VSLGVRSNNTRFPARVIGWDAGFHTARLLANVSCQIMVRLRSRAS
jgi:hypothetical protein